MGACNKRSSKSKANKRERERERRERERERERWEARVWERVELQKWE
jgi:hypothetical protein